MNPVALFAAAQNPLIGKDELIQSLAKCLAKKADSRFQLGKVNEQFFVLLDKKYVLLIAEQQTINLFLRNYEYINYQNFEELYPQINDQTVFACSALLISEFAFTSWFFHKKKIILLRKIMRTLSLDQVHFQDQIFFALNTKHSAPSVIPNFLYIPTDYINRELLEELALQTNKIYRIDSVNFIQDLA